MSDVLADLPDEVKAILRPHMEADQKFLDAISIEIADKRNEAVNARKASGIEAVWKDAEEAYIGIDDANRHEFADAKWAKPMSMDGPLTTNRQASGEPQHSTVFIRVTARYVDAGAAKLGEILLPADEKAFEFTETPVPDLIDAKDDEREVIHAELGVPLTRQPGPDEAASTPGQPQAPQEVPVKAKDFAREAIEMAREKAKAAETRIYDWMVECKYTAEARKVVFDAARIGVGVIKGPVPEVKKMMAVKKTGGKTTVYFKEKINPVTKWIDPWNFFPDAACGENIQNGNYTVERDYMSERQVGGLKDEPGYIGSQIDKVIKEGPRNSKKEGDDRGTSTVTNKNRYEVWYFHGSLTNEQMEAIDTAMGKEPPEEGYEKHVFVIVTMINDSVVKAVINPLDSGSFPYNAMPWQRRSQHWAGIGVAEQMRAPQRIVNGAARALLDNAGNAAGVQVFIDQRAFRPADGDWTVTPNKFWYLTEDAPPDIRNAFAVVEFPDLTEPLEKIIQLGERLAEETTSIPLITQGQSGATTPDTFGAAQLQNNNANQLLRTIGYSYDDCITEPLVQRYYEWLLLDPNVPDEEKGEFQINAHGSVALVERAIQDQTIGQLGQLVANPIYGKDPEKWADEYLRSKHLDPKSMSYTDEEKAKMKAAPPPEAPQITAAKINADTALKVAEMKLTTEQQSVQSAERIEQAAQVLEGGRIQNDQHATVVDATVRLHEIQAADNRTLEQLKTALAKVSMQLQTERALNQQNNAANRRRHAVDKAVDLHKHHNPSPKPPVQVPGRAGNGNSFNQG